MQNFDSAKNAEIFSSVPCPSAYSVGEPTADHATIPLGTVRVGRPLFQSHALREIDGIP
jgi:hypothetical protein